MKSTSTTQHHRGDIGIGREVTIIKQCDECGSDVERILDIDKVICWNCRREKNRVTSRENMKRMREKNKKSSRIGVKEV